jgi:hypothetical protein
MNGVGVRMRDEKLPKLQFYVTWNWMNSVLVTGAEHIGNPVQMD